MIAIACDHAGFEFKQKLIEYLNKNNLKFKDFGCFNPDSVDYPDYAMLSAGAVANGECDRGIVMCGTGIGVSITANKIKGIRCALCCDEFSARATREHNDANMLALGIRVIGEQTALKIVEIFLNTPFSNEPRHIRRIDKIKSLEQTN